jgi:hypothetical protein
MVTAAPSGLRRALGASLLGAAAIVLAIGWLAPHLPLRSGDIEIEAWGAILSILFIGCPLLAAAALGQALGRRPYLLPAAGSLIFSLGFMFAMGGAGYDDRSGKAVPIQIVFTLSTAAGALLAIGSTAALARPLGRAQLTVRAAWLMAVPLLATGAILAVIWSTAISSILATGTSSHTYYRAGSFPFFWAMVLHDAVVTTAVYLLAAGLLIARHPLAPLAGFFAASYLFAHFAPVIPIELYRLQARGDVEIPLLAVSCALVAAALGSAVHIARSALRAPDSAAGRASL